MAHYPVNHPLQPVYRAVAGLIGVGYLLFGAVGLAVSWGELFAGRGSVWALGLRTNVLWSAVSVLIGLTVLAAVVIGRNIHHRVTTVLGWTLAVIGVALLAVMQTDVNIFNFSVANVITCMVTGLLLIAAGLYGRIDAPDGEHTGPGVGHRPVSKVSGDELPQPVGDRRST